MLLVLKFGGSSLRSIEMINYVSRLIKEKRRKYDEIIVVVSAMGDETDILQNKINQIANNEYDNMEFQKMCMDTVMSSGEQVSSGLLALSLNRIGVKSIPLQAWQIDLEAKGDFGDGNISGLDKKKLQYLLDQGIIPIVSGFQAISKTDQNEIVDGILSRNIITLGRGGSDTTAVYLAKIFNADLCEIYTDVPGVFNADPNIVSKAKLIKKIGCSDLEMLSAAGAQIMHVKAARLACDSDLKIRICSTFALEEQGTFLSNANEDMPVCFVYRKLDLIKSDKKVFNQYILDRSYFYNLIDDIICAFYEETEIAKILMEIEGVNMEIEHDKVYEIRIIEFNPDAQHLNMMDIRRFLTQLNIDVLRMRKIEEDKSGYSIIVNGNDLHSTLKLLYSLVYPID